MNREEIELKPSVVSGSFNRIIESFKHNEREVDFSDPDSADDSGNRTLPHFLLSLGLSSLIVGIPALLAYFEVIQLGLGVSSSPYMLVPFAMVVPLVMFPLQLFFLTRELSNRKYIIRSEEVEIVDRYLDHGKDTASLRNITDVTMERPLTQRIFGTGNVLLNTAGSDDKEIKIEYIKHPETVQKQLSDMISDTDYKQPM